MKLSLLFYTALLALVLQQHDGVHAQRAAVSMASSSKVKRGGSGRSSSTSSRNNPMEGKHQKQRSSRRHNESPSDILHIQPHWIKTFFVSRKRLNTENFNRLVDQYNHQHDQQHHHQTLFWQVLGVTTLTCLALLAAHYRWLMSKNHQLQNKKQLVSNDRSLTASLSTKASLAMEDDDFSVDQDGRVVSKGGLDQQIDLAFQGIELEMTTKKKKQKKQKNLEDGDASNNGKRMLLDGSIHGRAKPGRMLAVMGPSGAGKSVFVHALAGRLKDTRKLSLSGKRFINGSPVQGDSLLPAAFVEQDVNFFPHMTVRETLDFRVSLKLGSLVKASERDAMVNNLMDQLGLTKSADTIVGNTKVRGLSGGERKRLSIAVEMISSPSLIFLDEPTSGLDSAAAASLVEKLRNLANQGKTIVAVIHQPSQHVFSMFDDLLLLSDGQQMYSGPVDKVRNYMEKQGYQAEKEVGTAEYVLECISRYPRVGETDIDAKKRVLVLAEAAKATKAAQTASMGLNDFDDKVSSSHYSAVANRHGPRAGVFRQFRLLMKRALQEAFRGKGVLILKTVQQVTVGLIYGGIYSLGTNQASIQDRYGLISLTAIGAANMAIAASLRAFPKEKAIVANEIASKMYSTLPYFVGKAISELPLVAFYNGIMMTILYKLTGLNNAPGKLREFMSVIMMHGLAAESLGLAIGAISANSDVALGLFPAVLILNIIFDGRNISVENTPKYLRWVSKIGLIRWGFEGLSVVEFSGLKFTTGGPRRGPVAKTGEEALERLGLGDRTLNQVFKAQLAITAACWCISYLGMTLTRQRFLEMKTPVER